MTAAAAPSVTAARAERAWDTAVGLLALAALTLLLHHSALSGSWRADDPMLLSFAAAFSPQQYFLTREGMLTLSYASITPWAALFFDSNLSLFGLDARGHYAHMLAVLWATAAATALWLRRWLDAPLAWGAGALFLAMPPTGAVAQQLMTGHYAWGLLFSVLALWAFARAVQEDSVGWACGAAVLYGLAALSRFRLRAGLRYAARRGRPRALPRHRARRGLAAHGLDGAAGARRAGSALVGEPGFALKPLGPWELAIQRAEDGPVIDVAGQLAVALPDPHREEPRLGVRIPTTGGRVALLDGELEAGRPFGHAHEPAFVAQCRQFEPVHGVNHQPYRLVFVLDQPGGPRTRRCTPQHQQQQAAQPLHGAGCAEGVASGNCPTNGAMCRRMIDFSFSA